MLQTESWYEADWAYQLHHKDCQQCRAAGANPYERPRCETGERLWQAYKDAGDPPHFVWLQKRSAPPRNDHPKRKFDASSYPVSL
jgi:hypothetical protein